MTGIASMAGREIASERLAAAIRSGSQEDEHSCFSDTTNNDLVANMEGLESILFGKFTSKSGKVVIDGKGVIDIIASADKELAGRMETQFRSAMLHIEKLFPSHLTRLSLLPTIPKVEGPSTRLLVR